MSDIEDLLDPILAVFRGRLKTVVQGHAVTAYLKGSAEMVEWGKTKTTERPIYFEGPPIEQAIAYAGKHCAKLVTQMDEETKTRLAQVISNAIDNKRGVDGLARDIRKEFDDMTKYRSQMIARTETCDALEQGFMDRAKDLGVTGKEWVTFDPCPICEEFGNEGVVPIDHVYKSSDGDVEVERPPAHPNCRCALAPAMLPK